MTEQDRLLTEEERAEALTKCYETTNRLPKYPTSREIDKMRDNALLEAQDAKTASMVLKEVGEYMGGTCPHDKRFKRVDCSLCNWELFEASEQGQMPDSE